MLGSELAGGAVEGRGEDSPLAFDWRLLEVVPAAICVCTADGSIVGFSPRAAELWGRTPRLGAADERFCGASRLCHIDGTPLPHSSAPMAMALRTGQPQRNQELLIERPDGSRVAVLANAELLRDASGTVRGAINCLQDVTALSRSEVPLGGTEWRRAAEEERQHLVSIVESSGDAIVSENLEGVIVSWNPAAQQLFGYSADEALGQPVAILYPDDQNEEDQTILARIRAGERVAPYETVRRRKNGNLLDVSLTVSPVLDQAGRIVGTSKIARDITARKRAEQALVQRMDEQAALYQLTDRLHRATTAADIYDAALDAIRRALRCERASVLRFDEQGMMRFVAWRGLSDQYRHAVDGHSPWTRETKNAAPIWVENVGRAGLAPELEAAIRREGIGALGFIPLMAGGRVIGKFMLYYRHARTFSGIEAELAVTIARQLGFGIERLRAEEELRRNEERERAYARELRAREAELEAIVSRTPFMLTRCGRDLRYRVVSEAYARMLGRRPEDVAGRSIVEVMGERGFAAIRPHIEQVLGGNQVEYESVVHFDGVGERYLHVVYTPEGDALGRVQGWIASIVDITERKRAESQRDLLVAELSHRVKNTLATVISIGRQSFARASAVDDARRLFEARIRALAQTHSRLAEANWAGVPLRTMLSDEFMPFRRDDGSNIRDHGPEVDLGPRCALTLGMAVHELATNAAKYGALSVRSGWIEVAWHIDRETQRLHILWTEAGGPPVSPPEGSGFGRLLLERALSADLEGEVALDFAPQGLRCAISIPLAGNVVRGAS